MISLSIDLANFFRDADKLAKETNHRVNSAVIIKAFVNRNGYIAEYFKQKGITPEKLSKVLDEEIENFKDGKEKLSDAYEQAFMNLGIDLSKQKSIQIVIKQQKQKAEKQSEEKVDEVKNEESNESTEEKTSIDISLEVYAILMDAYSISESIGAATISTSLFELAELALYKSESFERIAKALGIDSSDSLTWYNDLRENHVDKAKELVKNMTGTETLTPALEEGDAATDEDVKKLIVDLTAIQAQRETSIICNKEKQLDKMYQIFNRVKKNNVVVFGEEGVGKSALIEALAFEVAHDYTIPQLIGYKVISLKDTVNYLELVSEYGRLSALGKKLVKYLEDNENYIFVIDELPTSISTTEIYAITTFLKKAIAVISEKENARLVIVAQEYEYLLYFDLTNILPARFDSVEVEETRYNKIANLLRNQINEIKMVSGLRFSKEMLNFIITTSQCHYFTGSAEPGRTMEAIEKCIISAAYDGRYTITKKDVYKAFGIDIKKFNKLSLASKTSTAYHETGHYIVGLLSECKQSQKPTAISILPAANYAGVTIFNTTDQYASGNREWLVDMVAVDLAGRVGERMYTKVDSMGASADLRSAARIVYTTILNLGMGEKIGKNQVLPVELLNEKMKQDVYEDTQKIVEDAEKRAQEILDANKEALEEIVKLLLDEGIVSGTKLEKIVKKYQKQ